jgi:hypothetical protein
MRDSDVLLAGFTAQEFSELVKTGEVHEFAELDSAMEYLAQYRVDNLNLPPRKRRRRAEKRRW